MCQIEDLAERRLSAMAGGTPREWLSHDYYAVLGVPATASQEEIVSAYRRLARTVHPDFDAGNPQAAERFDELAAAREVLGDPQTRAAYDRIRWLRTAARRERPTSPDPPAPSRRTASRSSGPPVRPGPVIWVPEDADRARFVRREDRPW
jgi:curved DNA-binding protein CbpA